MTPFISSEGTDCLTNELLKAFCLHNCKCLLEESLGKLKWITRNWIAAVICKKTGIFLVAKFSARYLIISVRFVVPVLKQPVQMRLKPVPLKIHWSLFICVSWRKMFSFLSREMNWMNGKLITLLSPVVFQVRVTPYRQGSTGGQARCQWFSVQCKTDVIKIIQNAFLKFSHT